MLGIVLGFSGRIGRLHYFLLSTLLAFAAVALIFVIAFAAASHGAASDANGRAQMLCLLVVGPFFLWFSLALQAKRIRDIGWSPFMVILGWITAGVVDALIARMGLLHPTTGHNGTAFGVIVNLVMGGVLLFWPGGEQDTWTPSSRPLDPPRAPPAKPLSPSASVHQSAGAAIAFGRRGRA